ncbi:hypothetical protein [uncultured Adlercreutzia sp.]|uniref:hypothetical protein n=1 Tax=uncultured Adlercreutzia sp. TaxID=875803 RepID=UPI0026760874|nr:hypothetical protein [uncultured Adlercreutzia sp.]
MTPSAPTNRSAAPAGRAAAIHEQHGRGRDVPGDTWVHNLEAACALLIAFGCLISFATAAGCLNGAPAVHWIQDCLLTLPFPVLYFASGYLYQRYRSVRTPQAWAANLRREAVVLLVPFAVFTVLSLAANGLAGDGRPLTPGNLLDALFVRPVAPLGYFPVCLILIAITPTAASRRNASRLLLGALALKAAIVVLLSAPATAPAAGQLPWIVKAVAESWIWFACGVGASLFQVLPLLRSREKAWALGALWAAASVITFQAGWLGEASHAILDAIGIAWLTSLFSSAFRSGAQNAFFGFVSRYTMALWLVAPVVLKLLVAGLTAAGLTATGAPAICLGAGILAGFGAPVLIMAALERIGKLGFIVYPARYLPPAPVLIERKGVR